MKNVNHENEKDPVLSNHGASNIEVQVKPIYLTEHSDPKKDKYVFAYTVSIQNNSELAARLVSRHWIITDANGRTQEVKGMGVVGEQPYLNPGDSYTYTSGTILPTPIGCMYGSYQLISETGLNLEAEIPAFSLAKPNTLH